MKMDRNQSWHINCPEIWRNAVENAMLMGELAFWRGWIKPTCLNFGKVCI